MCFSFKFIALFLSDFMFQVLAKNLKYTYMLYLMLDVCLTWLENLDLK
jgi:hypothetical protein